MEGACCQKGCCRHNVASLIGRIIIGAIFILAALYKYNNWEMSVTQMANVGIPFPAIFLGIGMLLEVLGGLSLVLGYKTRFGAFLLILFLVPTTFLFHSFWAAPAADAIQQINDFIRNLFYFGALLLVLAFGPGHISFDARCCCHKECGPPCK